MEYISKAHQALTDPISRENFEKYGHPDGRQVVSMLRGETVHFASVFFSTMIVDLEES